MAIIKKLINRYTTILDRYLLKEYFGPFVLGVVGFAVIGIIEILFYLVEIAVVSGISPWVTIRLLLYKLPGIMVLFFPMAVLFSVMLLLVRMAKDNELTVLRSSGVPSWRFVVPIIFFAVITSYFSYFVNETIVPWSNETSEKVIRKEIQKKAPPEIKENILFKDDSNRFFFIKKVNSKLAEMDNVLIFDTSSRFPKIITAKKGYWSNQAWTLVDGHIQEHNTTGIIDFTDHFTEMTLHIDDDLASNFTRQKTTKEMDSKELKSKILSLNRGGISTRGLRVEYHMKKSVPVACLIFALIGIFYCVYFVRSGHDWWGVIVAICVAVLSVGFYFFMMALFRAFAKEGSLSPLLGAWFPNIIYGTIASIAITYNVIKK